MVQPQAQQPQAPMSPQMPPQAAQQGEPMAPEAQADPNAQGQPSGRAGQPYNPAIMQEIDSHIAQLQPQQLDYLAHYMTPELSLLFGIVMGQEAFDYFKQYADPQRELVVQPKTKQLPNSPQGPQQGQPVESSDSVIKPKQAKPPATTIMGR